MMTALSWLVRRVGGATLLIWTLLYAALMCLAWALSANVRGLDFGLTLFMMTAGMLLGWMLARSRVRALPAWLWIWGGVFLIALARVGQLMQDLIVLFAALWRVLWQAQIGHYDAQPLFQAANVLGAHVWVLLMRVWAWGAALQAGQTLYEPVAAALVWSFGLGLLAAWAVWRIRRAARAFDALLIPVLVLAQLLAYAGRDVWVMFVMLCLWLGLMVAVPFQTRQRQWEQNAVGYADGLGFDLAMVTVPTILVLTMFAVGMPVISPQTLQTWAEQWSSNSPVASQSFSSALGIEPAPAPRENTVLYRDSSPGMPRSHLVGAPPELLNELALTIRTDAANDFAPRYWLGTTYDTYTGQGWYSSGFKLQAYEKNERISDATIPANQIVRARVNASNFTGMVYTPGMPLSVDRNFQVAWRQPGDMFGAQTETDPYSVEAYVPQYNAELLRAAGQAYPDWIGTQYLRVPDSVPPRVIALARDLTAAQPTAYDRAAALETFLRKFPYTLDVPKPPAGRDITDYFLFDLQRGYCDYYATAMVILARAAGLPARIAVGYAAGEYDAASHTYRVLEANAHSWTQIYFPGYGWVDFEPTRGREAIPRDVPVTDAPPPPDFSAHTTNSPGAFTSQTVSSGGLFATGILFAGFVLAMALLLADEIYVRRAAPNVRAQILYGRIVWGATRTGMGVGTGSTPNQIVTRLENYFAAHTRARLFAYVWQPLPPMLDVIVTRYVETTYGAHTLSAHDATELIRLWRAVRVRFVLALWWDFVARTVTGLRVQAARKIPTRAGAK